MIIWGSKGKTKVIETGRFLCPRCRTARAYQKKKVGKYFTLYFIPLFETQKLGEFVECQTCFTPFETSVLSYNHEQVRKMREFVSLLEEQSAKGIPVNVMFNQLIEMGLEEEIANNLIAIITEGKLLVCESCRLVYSSKLKFCSGCGKQLSVPS
jgi:hypothetical protein